MQRLKSLIEEANKRIRTADHLVYMTYPMLQDPKLIMKIAENIADAMKYAIEAIVYYDRLYKRVSPMGEEFVSKYDIFKHHCSKRYNISPQHLLTFEDVNNIVQEHKNSPTSFVKDGSIVICSDQFQKVRRVGIDKVKSFLNDAKQFIIKANQIIK